VCNIELNKSEDCSKQARLGCLGQSPIILDRNVIKYYEQKRVEVIYTVEGEITNTVTVYIFYGQWQEKR